MAASKYSVSTTEVMDVDYQKEKSLLVVPNSGKFVADVVLTAIETRESQIQEKVTQLEEQVQQYQLILAEQNKKIIELQQQVKPVSEILDQLKKFEQTIQPMKTDVTTQTETSLTSSSTTDYTLEKLLESIQSLTSAHFVPMRRRYSSSAAMRRRSGSRVSRVSSGRGSMFNEYEDLLDNAEIQEEFEPPERVQPVSANNSSHDHNTTISSVQQDQALGSVLLSIEDFLQNIKHFRSFRS